MDKKALANELLKVHGIDMFDGEGYVRDEELDRLIGTFRKYKPEQKEDRPGYCDLCGEVMPRGEEMFKFHGYSGPCPKKADAAKEPTR